MKIKLRKVYEPLGWVLVGIGVLLLILICLKFFSLTHIAESTEEIDKDLTGAIGSFIGGTVGILFSLSAVIFFVVALYSQKDELELQRKELNLTRAVFKLQAFETTFFNLLQTQQQIRERLIFKHRSEPGSKEDILGDPDETFDYLAKKLDNDLDYYTCAKMLEEFALYGDGGDNYHSPILPTVELYTLSVHKKEFVKLENDREVYIYKCFLEEFNNILPHYLNNVYFTIKFIADTDLNMDESIKLETGFNRDTYINFMKAQMSRPEMYLIGQHSMAYPKFGELLDRLKYFENIDDDTYIMNIS